MHKITFFLLFLSLTSFASEREELLKDLSSRYDKAVSVFQTCEGTQLEMDNAATDVWIVAEPLLIDAAEWKIRNSKTVAERKAVLNTVYHIGHEVEAIFSAPREVTGSLELMQRPLLAADLIMRQIRIFLLPEAEAKRWDRISMASGIIDGQQIQLKNGRYFFYDAPYDQKEDVQLLAKLDPSFCFNYGGRDYAILTIDLPKSYNTDYLKLFLCQFCLGRIVEIIKLDVFCLEKIKLENGILFLEGKKPCQGGKYKKYIHLKEIR